MIQKNKFLNKTIKQSACRTDDLYVYERQTTRVEDPGVRAAPAPSGMTLCNERQTARGFTPSLVIPSTQAHVTPTLRASLCAGYRSFVVSPLYPALRHCGMTSGEVKGMTSGENSEATNAARGFTLIELLVVVLIIGILAAVALPQYKVAVVKSRVSAYFPLMKSIAAAETTYHLANGSYAMDMTKLDIDVPSGCTPVNVNQMFACGTDILIDASNGNIILSYCPSYSNTYSTCWDHRDLSVQFFYNGVNICTAKNNSALGQKVCNSLHLN